MDTKLMVAANIGVVELGQAMVDIKKLKDLLAMVELRATNKEPSKEEGQSPAANINPLLLASVRVGSWEALNFLLEREDAKKPPMMIPTQEFIELLARGSSSAQGRVAARDIEEGVDDQPPASLPAEALLKGVTPDGDTALHAVARSHKGGQHFLKYAGIIYDRDRGLLFAKNHNGDTPLHCAARAGNSKMVSHLIDLAVRQDADTKFRLLRMENNSHETALHEAVRYEDGRILGHKDREALLDADGTPEERIRVFVDQQEERSIVKLLMGTDPQLANYPAHGISPLYLAILLGKSTIALTLYDRSDGNLSYSGADGQNALHVAVLRDADKVMVELLLHWNKSLTAQVDKDGSTPLHFASSMDWPRHLHLFKANPAALYQADKKGFFPIHVAASVGSPVVRTIYGRECPDSVGLLDAKGRTFLHVAVEKEKLFLVSDACGDPSLAWILNMQDNEGNTALHLAIKGENLWKMVDALLWNRFVNFNLSNNHGETPLDVARSKVTQGKGYRLDPEYKIYDALLAVGANHGALRQDRADQKYSRRLTPDEEEKESNRLKDAAQTLIVASVLIATVAFSATFALPGGYRADDHTNGGTPTLAGSYVFDAFIMATTLAFTFSTIATAGFALAAAPMFSLTTRKINFVPSLLSVTSSITCMTIAFALGVYMLLSPVARNTAVAVCVIIPAVLLGPNMMGFSIFFNSALPPLVSWTSLVGGYARSWKSFVGGRAWLIQIVFFVVWPVIIICGWPALARILRHH